MSKVTIAIAKSSGIPENTVDQVLSEFRKFTVDSLRQGEPVRITDFIVFDCDDKPERNRRNPKTQELVVVPAERLAKARFSVNFEKDIQKVVAVESTTKAVIPLPPIPVELLPERAIALPPIPVELLPQPEVSKPEKLYFLNADKSFTLAQLKKKRLKPGIPVYTEQDGWKAYADIV